MATLLTILLDMQWKRKSDTYLHIFQAVLLADAPQNILFAAFLHFTCQQQFIEYKVRLLEIENNVQFTDIPIVFVHLFDIAVYYLKGNEFVVG